MAYFGSIFVALIWGVGVVKQNSSKIVDFDSFSTPFWTFGAGAKSLRVPNGVFWTVFFRFFTVPRLATEVNPFRETKTTWKHQCFQAFWCLLHLHILTNLQTQHSEKHRLENTVCCLLGEGRGTHFRTLFATFGPKGPNDPCSRKSVRRNLSVRSGVFVCMTVHIAVVLACSMLGHGFLAEGALADGHPEPYISLPFQRTAKGPAERGHVKKRQKSPKKRFSTLFDMFRAQKTSKIINKCQKSFRHFLILFAWKRALFGGSDHSGQNCYIPFLVLWGFIRRTPPGPHPQIRLALPSSGVDLGSKWGQIRKSMSNQCRIDAKSSPEVGKARRIWGWCPGACA